MEWTTAKLKQSNYWGSAAHRVSSLFLCCGFCISKWLFLAAGQWTNFRLCTRGIPGHAPLLSTNEAQLNVPFAADGYNAAESDVAVAKEFHIEQLLYPLTLKVGVAYPFCFVNPTCTGTCKSFCYRKVHSRTDGNIPERKCRNAIENLVFQRLHFTSYINRQKGSLQLQILREFE